MDQGPGKDDKGVGDTERRGARFSRVAERLQSRNGGVEVNVDENLAQCVQKCASKYLK